MKNDKLSTKRSNGLLLCATAVAALASSGCATEADDGQAEAEATQSEGPLALQTSSGSTTLRDPNGIYFADVFANGTGCPAGSWKTSISADGKVFTTTFSEYEALVDRNASFSVKDCLISIKLHSPAGTSYAVQQFHYSGYALLDQGVTARQTASYYFQGMPIGAKENRTELVGPKDESYLFSDEVKTVDQVWSPCGKERDLQIATRVRVDNAVRRDGYINLSAIDAKVDGKIVLKLGVKKCDGSTGGSDGDSGSDEDSASDEDNNNGGSNNGGWNGGGRDNGGRDNGGRDNGGWNGGGWTGGGRDNGGRDNGGRDNGGRDNGGRDNGGRDNGGSTRPGSTPTWPSGPVVGGGPVVVGGNRDSNGIGRTVR